MKLKSVQEIRIFLGASRSPHRPQLQLHLRRSPPRRLLDPRCSPRICAQHWASSRILERDLDYTEFGNPLGLNVALWDWNGKEKTDRNSLFLSLSISLAKVLSPFSQPFYIILRRNRATYHRHIHKAHDFTPIKIYILKSWLKGLNLFTKRKHKL